MPYLDMNVPFFFKESSITFTLSWMEWTMPAVPDMCKKKHDGVSKASDEDQYTACNRAIQLFHAIIKLGVIFLPNFIIIVAQASLVFR